MNGHKRDRRLLHAVTWIGTGALSTLLFVTATHAGPLDDLRRLHRAHERVHQEIRREVGHALHDIVGGDRDRSRARDRHHDGRRAPRIEQRHRHGHVPPGHLRDRHYARPPHAVRVVRPPLRIESRFVARYRPYYAGSVWFGPHGHHHEVYDFPVATPDGIRYVPRHYCNGTLLRLDYVRPGLHVSVGF